MVGQNFEAKKIKLWHKFLRHKVETDIEIKSQKDFLSNNCDFRVSNNLVFYAIITIYQSMIFFRM